MLATLGRLQREKPALLSDELCSIFKSSLFPGLPLHIYLLHSLRVGGIHIVWVHVAPDQPTSLSVPVAAS